MIKKVCKKEISVLFVLYLIILKHLIRKQESSFTIYLLYLITSFSIQKEIKSQVRSKKTPDNVKKDFDICGKEPINNSKTANLCSGKYYYNARWYDPQLGRFITEDPARAGNNYYIYVSNNPLKFIDPTGFMGKAAALAAAETGEDIPDTDSSYGHTLPSFGERKETGEYSPKEDFRFDINDLDLMPVTYKDDILGYGAEAEGRKNQLEEFDVTKNTALAGMLGASSMGLNVAGLAAMAVAPPSAPVFFSTAAALDFMAAGLYYKEGEYISAGLSFTSGIIGLSPSAVGFNNAANRYINSSSKIFISQQQAIKTGAREMATAGSLYTAGVVVPSMTDKD